MTLIVGALFPWDELLKSPRFQIALQRELPQSAIIAADSRWTWESGKTEDGAVKLFGIGEPCIVAYAGNAGAGENAFAALSTKLGRTQTVEEFANMIRDILVGAWRDHPYKDDELDILFGLSMTDRSAWLGHFSASDGFMPHAIEDMKVIGPAAARRYFREALRDGTREVLADASMRAVSPDVVTWATRLMDTVRETCEKQADAAVGGDVLCGHTTLGKARGQGGVRVDVESGKVRAKEIGLHPREGKTVRKFWEYRPPDESR